MTSQQSGRGGASAQNPVVEVSFVFVFLEVIFCCFEVSRFEPERLTSLAVAQLANMRL